MPEQCTVQQAIILCLLFLPFICNVPVASSTILFFQQVHANYASSKNTQCRHSETFQLIVVLGLNLVVSLMYFVLFGYGIHNMLSHRHEAGLIYSPARSAVTYEAKVVDDSVPAAFAGPPSLETDAAWQRLLKCTRKIYIKHDNNLVVQKEDLNQVDRSSVSLRDGSGYLASLSVYHQLHCLNYIRQYAFPDYYTRGDGKLGSSVHIYHCIDTLRRIIMCHGDITPRTFEWSDLERHPVMKPRSVHECRKWEPIETYAKSHVPSRANGPILENPESG
ncbi:DUF3328 domain protein [Metarhizium robertsii]|uniref:DUF3328 domain protein n=1 Tax=Metarhizium robertsii TaxID=568076 RepID=A0A0A1UNA2_9HYPO|nr:DUF3328 domain protein [Metarhizium robertsii]